MPKAHNPIALTDTERRRLHESLESDDPMLIAEAEQAMSGALAELECEQ
jgi:hypothetical protein